MGISKKYAYRDTWMRYADLQAESGAIADWNTVRTTPAGKNGRTLTREGSGRFR